MDRKRYFALSKNMFIVVSVQTEWKRHIRVLIYLIIYCNSLCKTLAWIEFGYEDTKLRFAFFEVIKRVSKSWQINFWSSSEQVLLTLVVVMWGNLYYCSLMMKSINKLRCILYQTYKEWVYMILGRDTFHRRKRHLSFAWQVERDFCLIDNWFSLLFRLKFI